MFQGVSGNRGLTVLENSGRNLRKYYFHIGKHHIHFGLIESQQTRNVYKNQLLTVNSLNNV